MTCREGSGSQGGRSDDTIVNVAMSFDTPRLASTSPGLAGEDLSSKPGPTPFWCACARAAARFSGESAWLERYATARHSPSIFQMDARWDSPLTCRRRTSAGGALMQLKRNLATMVALGTMALLHRRRSGGGASEGFRIRVRTAAAPVGGRNAKSAFAHCGGSQQPLPGQSARQRSRARPRRQRARGGGQG